MKIVNVYISILQFRRALQILGILTKHSLGELFSHTRFSRRRRRKVQKTVHTTPERIRMTIEDLGPTFVKFGQILADRPDMVSEKFRIELKKLQSRALPFDNDYALSLIEKELGAPIDEIFSEFNTTPLAAASIGQVYEGRLRSGDEVIVKIRRPYIENKIKLDIYLLKHLARSFAKRYPELAAVNIVGLIDEFSATILKELDYTLEASNIYRFQTMFKDDPTVHIPLVYSRYCTKRLLVMERIRGIAPDDPPALRAAGLDTHRIAVNGADMLLTMILRHGFFHADPHPGNLRIRGGQILWIDLGMMGRLSPRDQKLLGEAVRAISHHDVDAMRRVLLALGQPKGPVDHAQINADIDALLSRYAETDLESVSMPQLLDDVLALAKRHGIALPPGMSMLARGLSTIEGVVVALDPHFNIMRATAAHISRDAFTQEAARKKLKSAAASVYDSLDKSLDLPALAADWLKAFNRGSAKLNLELSPSEGLARALLALGNRLILSLLALALLTGGALLCANGPAPFVLGASALGLICVALGLCLSVGLILSILRKRK